ncbi:hypothetical protein SAMN02745975_03101 [Geosporobacter subterraneus DSM 17957]|uniref:Transposase C of IS166 homeodomain-containing protein n=1 Tax=Geosporobacter subterraneus DSM 17957 TaxID=1121919 RepID=A0A1M6MUJ3_9FIRM|nr:hypothetical protein [Geosporobacter subterraneus]SHJ87086.1 hypothetical protein SAMN02745975_03101 [Geosporobacter subterraneus DSM 17957]
MANTVQIKELQLNRESKNLKNEIEKLQHELEIANAKIKWYEEQLKLNAVKKYGKSSDRVDEGRSHFLMKRKLLQGQK